MSAIQRQPLQEEILQQSAYCQASMLAAVGITDKLTSIFFNVYFSESYFFLRAPLRRSNCTDVQHQERQCKTHHRTPWQSRVIQAQTACEELHAESNPTCKNSPISASTKSLQHLTDLASRTVAFAMLYRLSSPVKSRTPPRYLQAG